MALAWAAWAPGALASEVLGAPGGDEREIYSEAVVGALDSVELSLAEEEMVWRRAWWTPPRGGGLRASATSRTECEKLARGISA